MAVHLVNADVRAVVASLDDEPHLWRPFYIGSNLYGLTHPSGLRLWTRNRPYGLEIFAPDGRSIYGGVTFLSTFNMSIGRWALWFAIRRWERLHSAPVKPLPSAAQLLRGETA
jgi:hypothetical protein